MFLKRADYDGSLFSSRETAEGRLDGEGTRVVGEEPTKVYIPQAAAKNIESIETVEGKTPRFFVDRYRSTNIS